MGYTFLDLLGLNPLRPMVAFGGDDSGGGGGGGGGSDDGGSSSSNTTSAPTEDITFTTIDLDTGEQDDVVTYSHMGNTYDNVFDYHDAVFGDDDDDPAPAVTTTPTYTDTSSIAGISDASGVDYTVPDVEDDPLDPFGGAGPDIVTTPTTSDPDLSDYDFGFDTGSDSEPAFEPYEVATTDPVTAFEPAVSDPVVDYGGDGKMDADLGVGMSPVTVTADDLTGDGSDIMTLDTSGGGSVTIPVDSGYTDPLISGDITSDSIVGGGVSQPVEPPAPPPVYYDMFGNEYGSQEEAASADDLYNTVISTPATEAVTPTLEAGFDVDPAELYEPQPLADVNVPVPESYMPTSEDLMPGITGTDVPRAEEDDIRALYGMEPLETETDAIQTDLDDLLGGGDDLVEGSGVEADELALELGLPTVDLEDYTPTSAELYGGDVPQPLSVEEQVAQYGEGMLRDYESAPGETYGGMDVRDLINESSADQQADITMENLINTGTLDDTIVAGTEVTPSQAIQDPNIFNYEGDNFIYAGNEDITYGINATKNAQPFENIVFHHTGNNYPAENQVNYSQTFDEERGGRFGYHFVVGKDGTVYQSAPLDARTNHLLSSDLKDDFKNVTSANSIGISLVGAGDEDFTPEQIAAAQDLAQQLQGSIDTITGVYGQGAIQSGKMASEGVTLANMVNQANAPIETDFDVFPTADGAVTSDEIDNLLNEATGGTIRTGAKDADLAVGLPEEIIDVPITVPGDSDVVVGGFPEVPTGRADTSTLESVLEESGIQMPVADFVPEPDLDVPEVSKIDTDTAVAEALGRVGAETPVDIDAQTAAAKAALEQQVPDADITAIQEQLASDIEPGLMEQAVAFGARALIPGFGTYIADEILTAGPEQRQAIVDQHVRALERGATPLYDDEGNYTGFDRSTMGTFADEVLAADDITAFLPPTPDMSEEEIARRADSNDDGIPDVERFEEVFEAQQAAADADPLGLSTEEGFIMTGDDGQVGTEDDREFFVTSGGDVVEVRGDGEGEDRDIVDLDLNPDDVDQVIEEVLGITEEEDEGDEPINPCPEGYVLDPETNECVPIADVGDEGPSKPKFKDVEREIIRRPERPTPTPEEVEGLIIRTPSFAQGGPVTRNIDSFVRSMRG